MSAIEARGVEKRFGETVAVAGADLVVAAGTMHGLLGPNGAGKTTLVRMLLGLVRADAGSISLLDQPLAFGRGLPPEVAGFADLPSFTPYLSGRRNLELLARLDGLGADSAQIVSLLDQVGLGDRADRHVGGYSTGMRQRLGLAAALLRRPRLLVLDEPLTGLDASGDREVRDLLRRLVEDGVTVVVSSHDLDHVEESCDEVTIVSAGRVAFTGTLDELRAAAPDPRHRLHTSDDAAAATVVAARGLAASRLPTHLLVEASQRQLDDVVLALAAAGIAVRELSTISSSLESRFLDITGAAA